MKKLFLFATAALVLASCNNDVTISENTALVGSNAQKEIAFSPYAQGPKRAISNTNYGIIEGTTFDKTWGMTVSAYDVTNHQQYFTGTNFVYNNTMNLWNGEEHRYWPLSATQINFLAIAHANDDNATDVEWTQENTPTPTHKVVVEMSDNYAYDDAQRDFMYAIGAGEVTNPSGNTLVFPDKVAMTFKHTQAYLIFKVKAADDASKAIHITNIKVKGARTSGTATIARVNPNTYNDATVSLHWDASTTGYHTNADTYESVTEDQDDIDYTLTTSSVEKGHLLVVPNMNAAFTGSNESVYQNGFTSFEISYTLNGAPFTYEYTPASTVLMAGKKYTYDITFKLHEIFVSPSITDWEAETATTINIPSFAYNEGDIAYTYNVANTLGQYSVTISGCAANTTYDVSEAVAADWLAETDGDYDATATSYTSDANGNLTIYFTVTAQANNADARNATITLTNHDVTSKFTQVKVAQAAGPVVAVP